MKYKVTTFENTNPNFYIADLLEKEGDEYFVNRSLNELITRLTNEGFNIFIRNDLMTFSYGVGVPKGEK